MRHLEESSLEKSFNLRGGYISSVNHGRPGILGVPLHAI